MRMARALALAALATGALPAVASAGAVITIINADGPGEGFNDPTPATPIGGNTGVTVGEQRLQLFQHAADRWGALLDSAVQIRIQANFDPLTCTATSAVLGSAGAMSAFSDFPNAPSAAVWYPGALADKLAGEDLDPGSPDIGARFNSNLNGNAGCLNGATWYYGFDSNEGTNQTDLLPVLMHEFGHGLGFQSFVDKNTGAMFLGLPDHYLIWMFDNQVGKLWRNMSDGERALSGKNGRRVVWNGPNLLAAAPEYLNPGTATLLVSAPATAAGRYLVGEAAFGAPLTTTPVAGELAYLPDSAGAFNGCAPYAAGAFAGRIALIDRGVCGFTIKVKNAQDAGALAVVIADNAAGTPPATLGGADPTITISAVRVTLAAGTTFKTALGNGAVSLSLLRDPTVLAGADEANRVMLYTPDPVAPGSNVSHFDTSTSPNTLMEPAINSDLTGGVDLTLPLFRDLGWYPDADNDLVPDGQDNCIYVPDASQLDSDGDHVGDVCDDDDDADGHADRNDNCRLLANPGQENLDGDLEGDMCDADDDGDGHGDGADNCPRAANPTQADRNADGAGDVCDDEDGDGVLDASDSCPDAADPTQADIDGDGAGDVCDADDDGDGAADGADNCALVANPGQEDLDGDGVGDVCENDTDGDGAADGADNCARVANPGQEDLDGDGAGDVCDGDDDGDGFDDGADNCARVANPGQEDLDADEIGDVCDLDDDGDGAADGADNCARLANPGQEDLDADGVGNACDTDDDGDGVADGADGCPLAADPAQTNSDGDANGNDACDPDDDNDYIPDASDNCRLAANSGQADADGDGSGDVCDTDDDNDGTLDASDNCPFTASPDQTDSDRDRQGDVCDLDDDGDGVLDTADNCRLTSNLEQLDTDADRQGNACDLDDDNDSVLDVRDNCPLNGNGNQRDSDGDGLGDACDPHDDDEGGGCSASGSPSGGALWLVLLLGALRRRRKKA